MNKKQDQTEIRKDKLIKLRDSGIDPYPHSFENRIDAADALGMKEGKKLRVCGRVMSRRIMGKSSFVHIKDVSGQIQIFMAVDKLGKENYALFRDTDIGDFIGVEGDLFVTRAGEKTVMAETFIVLSKSLRPLPEKWHGLKDVETRYRKRYLDILVNPESSKILKARSIITASIREFLECRKFCEVHTPVLQDIAGGAAARPFKTLHNVYNTELYMRIAPELYLKRLLVGGWERVFELGTNFRNEGLSAMHNPEFTMLEVYAAYTDYTFMMNLAEELIKSVAAVMKEKSFPVSEDILGRWDRKDYWQLLKTHTGEDFSPEITYEEAKQKADKLNIPPGKDSLEKILDRIFSHYVEDKLSAPTFVTGYPSSASPLAKQSPDNPMIAERFEIFINGSELGNAYSEQNDPEIQKKVFLKQAGSNTPVDEDYIEALEYGMPPASGLGIGVDRLTMALTGAETIREVLLFPMLKPLNADSRE